MQTQTETTLQYVDTLDQLIDRMRAVNPNMYNTPGAGTGGKRRKTRRHRRQRS